MSYSQILKDKSISNGIQFLWNIIEQISEDPVSDKSRDFLTDLPNILFIILGAENKKGWLTQSFEDLNNPTRFSTVKAEENIRQLILLLTPPIITYHLENISYRENIYTLLFEKELVEGQKFQLLSNVLPDHITELRKNCVWKHPSLTRFQNLFSSEVSHIAGQFIVINPGDWFLFALAFNLKNFRPSISLKAARSGQDSTIDPYSLEFIENPFLLLTRRYLEYFNFLSFSQMQEHKDKRNLFKKFCFILEEHLMVEQIFNIHPQNIEILLHYSLLDGLQFSEIRQSFPARKKSLNPNDMDSSTISGDSKIMGNMYESQLSQGSKIGSGQTSQIHQQQQMNISNLSNQGNQQSTLLSSTTDIMDTFSGYSKNNILSIFQQITSIKEFSGKKSKDVFSVNSNYVFQALLILLHYKRRHFKLQTISSIYSNATSSNLRSNSALNNNSYYQNNSMLYQYQGLRKSNVQGGAYSTPYVAAGASATNPQMGYGNNQYSKPSQQYYIRLHQQYLNYRDFDNKNITADQLQLEYFRDHGEDNMLTLFYKKLCYFLSISLDDWLKGATKQAKETLYDQGRLLVSLIGHHKYFLWDSCENNLFSFLNSEDRYQLSMSTHHAHRTSTGSVINTSGYSNIQNPAQNLNSQGINNNFQGQYEEERIPIPNRPLPYQFNINEGEFEKLMPDLYTVETTGFSNNQPQFVRTTYKQQIGYFSEELSQLRFKILASSCTILFNKFVTAFATSKDLSVNDYLILILLVDIVFKRRDTGNPMNSSSFGSLQGSDEDLISRLNSLDLVTIKHANEFFLLRENDDIYKVFTSPESFQPLRKMISDLSLYLKKKSSQKIPSNIIDISSPFPLNESNPVVICTFLFEKLTQIQEIYSRSGNYRNATSKDNRDDNYNKRSNIFQIENKRISYDFQDWKTPLASFESKFLYYLMIQLSFFIDYVKNGFTVPINKPKYPKTNLRQFANVYVTLSIIFLFLFLIFIFKWMFFPSSSPSFYSSSYKTNTYSKSNQDNKFGWE